MSLKAGFVLIDYAGPGLRVYQFTAGQDHPMSPRGMKQLLTAAGFLEDDDGGTMCRSQSANAQKLEFYWVVAPALILKMGTTKTPKQCLQLKSPNRKRTHSMITGLITLSNMPWRCLKIQTGQLLS